MAFTENETPCGDTSMPCGSINEPPCGDTSMPCGRINETTKWQDLTEGLQIYEPATSKSFMTGEWRINTPVTDWDNCRHCLLCVPYCPDSCILAEGGKRLEIDYDHCKGCGICVAACPFGAISMKEGK